MQTIAELVSTARRDVLDNDTIAPYRWSDAQVTQWANEAIQEACARAPLLYDESTISVVAGTASYSIDSTIRRITNAQLTLLDYPLKQTTDAELTVKRGRYWRKREGTPSHYIRRGHRITIFPIPLVNDTLTLQTTNNFVIGSTIDLDADIDTRYHVDLMHWIAHKAFISDRRDPDLHDPERSAAHLSLFESAFGFKHSAKYEENVFDTPVNPIQIYSRY